MPTAQIGPYIVMTRRDGAPPPFDDPAAAPADPGGWPGLDDPDPEVQLATARAIHAGRDPRGAVALAARAARGDTPYGYTFVQMSAEFGDERTLPSLIRIVVAAADDGGRTPAATMMGEVATAAVYFSLEKALLADYWFVPPPAARRRAVAAEELDPTLMNAWLHDRDADPRLRVAAAWAAAWREDQDAVPHLFVMLGSSNLEVAKFAAYALMRLGHVEATAESLIALLHWDDLAMPSLLLDLYRHDPDRVRPALQRGLRRGTMQERVALTWVAAASGDRQLLPVLSEVRDGVEFDAGLRRITEAAIAVLDAGKQPAETS